MICDYDTPNSCAVHGCQRGDDDPCRRRLVDALSAPGGVCDDNPEPHSHGGFCVNWRPL